MTWSAGSTSPRTLADRRLARLLRGSAAAAGAIASLILVFVGIEAAPVLLDIGPLRFLSDPSWHPTSERFNLLPMLAGTLLVGALGMMLAAPIGLLAAVYLRFFASPRVRRALKVLIELLAGVPAVIYGFWGMVTLVPLIASFRPPGPSLLAASLVLGLMTLPTVTLLAHAALEELPEELFRNAGALGLSKWTTVTRVALPAARVGVLSALLLAAARAYGETMAVLMLAGNVVQIPGGVFDPVRTLTANIALEMTFALENHRAALFVSGAVLLAMVVALVATVDLFREHARA